MVYGGLGKQNVNRRMCVLYGTDDKMILCWGVHRICVERMRETLCLSGIQSQKKLNKFKGSCTPQEVRERMRRKLRLERLND